MGGHGNSMGGAIVDGGTFRLVEDRQLSDAVGAAPGIWRHGARTRPSAISPSRLPAACSACATSGRPSSPFNAFLILTGIETLPLRMQRHCDNALDGGRAGCPTTRRSPGSTIRDCRRQAITTLAEEICPKGAGAVFTFGLKGGYDAGVKLVSRARSFSRISPMSAIRVRWSSIRPRRRIASFPTSRRPAGAGPDVVRLSIGIEDVDDIIADLDQALAKT